MHYIRLQVSTAVTFAVCICIPEAPAFATLRHPLAVGGTPPTYKKHTA